MTTSALSLAAATAWLAPLPPKLVSKCEARTVSPQMGMRATVVVRSILVEPMTPMRGRFGMSFLPFGKCGSSPEVALLGKRENRLEEIGDRTRGFLARFRVAAQGDAAFGAGLELSGGVCARHRLSVPLHREDASSRFRRQAPQTGAYVSSVLRLCRDVRGIV